MVPVKRLRAAKTRLRGAVAGAAARRAGAGHGPGHGRRGAAPARRSAGSSRSPTTRLAPRRWPRSARECVPDEPGGRPQRGRSRYGAGRRGPARRSSRCSPPTCRRCAPAELTPALRRRPRPPAAAFVADAARHRHRAAGRPAGLPLDPRFGPGSAAAHARGRRGGARRRLAGPAPRRRHRADLAAAAPGLGAHRSARPRLTDRAPGADAGERGRCRAPWRRSTRTPAPARCCSTTAPSCAFAGAAFAVRAAAAAARPAGPDGADAARSWVGSRVNHAAIIHLGTGMMAGATSPSPDHAAHRPRRTGRRHGPRRPAMASCPVGRQPRRRAGRRRRPGGH